MRPWPAKRVITQIAENHAVKIRSALLVSVNARRVAREYMASNPTVTDNATADRVKARAWALINVDQDLAPLTRMIIQTRIDGWLIGRKSADHSIKQAALKLKQVSIIDIALDPHADVWENWKPGDLVSAEQLSRTYGLDLLLQQAGITIKEVEKTTIDRIGSRLADGLRQGLSVNDIADSIQSEVGSPARALTIAMTETTRATSLAAVDRYKEASITRMQWSAMDPCDECAKNDGQIVDIGSPFATGDFEPPVHPNCLCGVLPVIEKAPYEETNRELDEAAENVMSDSTGRERVLTEELIGIQRELATLGLEPAFSGLRYRLKQKGSLKRKIRDEFSKGEFPTIKAVADNLSDTVRYTYVWNDKNYLKGIQTTLDSLAVKGYGLKVKNYWERDDYKGFNVAVTDKKGKLFELQFHTASSVAVKEELHKLYEKYRVTKNIHTRWDLWVAMTKKAKEITTPENYKEILKIGSLKYEYFTDYRGVRRFGDPSTWIDDWPVDE